MRRISILLLIWGAFIFAATPKVGVVLSGGGARGFAHIPVLQALDSLQIPVSFIAGTSMGGIASGLYSIGYSGDSIHALVQSIDWNEIFSDTPPRSVVPYLQKFDDGWYQLSFELKDFTPKPPESFVRGQKISQLLSRMTLHTGSYSSFDDFAIPFRCVAVDLVSGNEVVLKEGSLARALRATMSVPTVFSPVEWGDSLLVDGGILNNLPVDVVREMGADFIIAVNVGEYLKPRDELDNIAGVAEQMFNIPLYPRIEENRRHSDIFIQPDLQGLSSTSFNAEEIDSIISRGKTAVNAALPRLQKLADRLRTPSTVTDSIVTIGKIRISGSYYLPDSAMRRDLKLAGGQRSPLQKIEKHLRTLKTDGPFDSLGWTWQAAPDGKNDLLVNIKDSRRPIVFRVLIDGNYSVSFGLIYNLLDIEPGDTLNIDNLEKQIDLIYGLGYFEQISYLISPVKNDKVELRLKVKEGARRQLLLGLHYDNLYKLVGLVGIKGDGLLIPDLRQHVFIQFSGLTRIGSEVSYPSQSLRRPIIPFVRWMYRDIPIDIFDIPTARKLASYNDRGFTAGFGLATLIGLSARLEGELRQEWLDINPSVASLPDSVFPAWRNNLRQLRLRFHYDGLDDIALPRHGMELRATYEGSLRSLGTDLPYYSLSADARVVKTLYQKHSFITSFFFGWSGDTLPVYKWHYRGGGESFVGADYNQLIGRRYATARLDYRFEYKKDIFLKLIANAGFNLDRDFVPRPTRDVIWGGGIGVQFLSVLGPLEFVAARGRAAFYKEAPLSTHFYLTLGARLEMLTGRHYANP